MAFINDGGQENTSGEQSPEEQGWEVLSIDNAGHEESPAQVIGVYNLINKIFYTSNNLIIF